MNCECVHVRVRVLQCWTVGVFEDARPHEKPTRSGTGRQTGLEDELLSVFILIWTPPQSAGVLFVVDLQDLV